MTELLTDIKDALLLSKIQKAIQKNKEDINICDRVIKIIINETESRNGNNNSNNQIISNEHKHKYEIASAENKDQNAEESND